MSGSHAPKKLYGTATVGTKGQIVIPAEARQALDIKPGDKLFVTGMGHKNALGLIPADSLESLMKEMTERLDALKNVQENQSEK